MAEARRARAEAAVKECVELLQIHAASPGFLRNVLAAVPAEKRSALATLLVEKECETAMGPGSHMRGVTRLVEDLKDEQLHAIGVAAVSQHMDQGAKESVQRADADGDGQISSDEFQNFLRAQVGKDKASADMPSRRQLFWFSLNSSIPFFVFGLLDNSIMIVGGDVVDDIIGSHFALSTLACAALANTFADVLGISVGNTVEGLVSKLGLPQANLTARQSELPAVHRLGLASGSVGILLGCLAGMFPLLWIDQERRNFTKEFEEIDEDEDGYAETDEFEHLLMHVGFRVSPETSVDIFYHYCVEGRITEEQAWEALKEVKVLFAERKQAREGLQKSTRTTSALA